MNEYNLYLKLLPIVFMHKIGRPYTPCQQSSMVDQHVLSATFEALLNLQE